MHIEQSIRLQIRRAEPAPMVDDQAFPRWHASIALSNDLRAVFSNSGRLLTHAELEILGLTSTELWDLAAEHTVTAQVLIRPHALGGIEVASNPGSAVDWLAHPHSFWLLHIHLQQVLGGTIIYFLPTQHTLVASPWAPAKLLKLQRWASETCKQAGETALIPYGVMYQHGYPAPLSQEYTFAR